MEGSLLIKNIKILYDNNLIEGEIAIDKGKIIRIGKNRNMPSTETVLEGEGMIALPGLIDVHVHLRDMQLSYKEDFYSGTCAAAAGGFTTVIDMPNTVPPTDSLQRLKEKINSAKNQIVTNISFHLMAPRRNNEIDDLVNAGAKSFKIFLGGVYMEEYDHTQILRLIQASERLRIPLTIHAERGDLKTKKLSKKKIWNINDYLKKHSITSELEGVKNFLSIAQNHDPVIHFCHISSMESLRYILNISTSAKIIREVTPHHLFLTQKIFREKGSVALTNPPVRDPSTRRSLWKSFVEGHFDVIASDHAPHRLSEKEVDDVKKVPPGIPGLETTLPLLLTEVNRGNIKLSKIVELLSYNPARIYGYSKKGRVKEGFDGDIILVDMKKKHQIKASQFHSKAKYTPFENVECTGKAVKTIISGRLVMDEGEINTERGSGKVIL